MAEGAENTDTATGYDIAMGRLTDRQRRFVEEYLIDLCAGAAAARAGYSKKTKYQQGSWLLRNPKVHAAIQAAMNDLAVRAHISQQWVIESLKNNARRATRKGDFAAVNKALDLIGRTIGMFRDELNINLPEPARVVLHYPDNGRGPGAKGNQ